MSAPLLQFCSVTKDFESGLLPWTASESAPSTR